MNNVKPPIAELNLDLIGNRTIVLDKKDPWRTLSSGRTTCLLGVLLNHC
jgi:hypothetical protein